MYHTILIRQTDGDPWEISYGSDDRGDIDSEIEDYEWNSNDLCIKVIDTETDDQATIDGIVAALNVGDLECKVLTIDPIWVWAIFKGIKLVENRSWSTKHRGLLVIHASQNKRREREAREWIAKYTTYTAPDSEVMERMAGRLIGVVQLVDCVAKDKLPECEQEFAVGPVCWRLRNPTEFCYQPEIRGKQGMWKLPDNLTSEIMRYGKEESKEPGRTSTLGKEAGGYA